MDTIAEVPEVLEIKVGPFDRGQLEFPEELPTSSLALKDESSHSLEAIAQALERSVPIRNNHYHFRVYKNTFVGSECIDYLVRAHFASSRSEAVALGRRLANEMTLFEHVALDHELKDEFLFYRFTDPSRRTNRTTIGETIRLERSEDLAHTADILRQKVTVRDRIYRLRKYRRVFVASDVVTLMIKNGMASSREDAVDLGQRLQKEFGLWHHVCRDHLFTDDYLFFRFSAVESKNQKDFDDSDSYFTNHSISVSVSDMTRNELHSIAEQLRRGLEVKDRTYRLKTYTSCFVASEAVDFMVKERLARSRDEAVELGRLLAKQFQLWHHVTNDHFFSDRYLFFRFRVALDQELFTKRKGDREAQLGGSETSLDLSVQNVNDVAHKLIRGLEIKDRVYKLRVYKSCFVASEAVDFMVQARLVASRGEAVELGKKLGEHEIFHHVKNEHNFSDDYLFFRFSEQLVSRNQEDLKHESTNDDSSTDLDSSGRKSIQSYGYDELVAIGDQLKRGVRIKHRRYRLKNYRNCFIGSEAVDYIVQAGYADSREIAVHIGRRLEAELDFLHHISNDHQFEDAYLFYRFGTTDRTTSDVSLSTLASSRSSSLGSYGDISQPRLQFEKRHLIYQEEHLQLKRYAKQFDGSSLAVLIRGPSGCGKKTLVNHALSSVFAIVATAKANQRFHLSSLSIIRNIFKDLAEAIRISPMFKPCQAELDSIFKNARESQGLLGIWIPEIGSLFTACPHAGSVVGRSDEIDILKKGMQLFLIAVSGVTPVLMCIHDMTDAEHDTLDVLRFLFTQELKNVLLVVTFLEKEGSEKHELKTWEAELTDNMPCEIMILENMNIDRVHDFLVAALKREPDDVLDLSLLLFERTHGNVFFLVQTLESLQDLWLLTYDYTKLQWVFSVDAIRSRALFSDNVGELLARRIEKLPRDVQQLLKLASCFGSSFDPRVLEECKLVLFIFDDFRTCLQSACQEELVVIQSERKFSFAHALVQSAAYELLPQGYERKRIHWDIACILSVNTPKGKSNDSAWYFTLADQLERAGEVMRAEITELDKPRFASLIYQTGKKAAAISAFGPASNYFQMGIDLLDDPRKAFSAHHGLASKLYTSCARVMLSAGEVEKSREVSERLLSYARLEADRQKAYLTIFRCLSAENKLDEHIEYGLNLLDRHGIKVPVSPKRIQVTFEYERAKLELKKFTDDDVFSLPQMADKKIEFCIEILTDIIFAATPFRKNNLISFALSKLIQLTLKLGSCKFTPVIFVLTGQEIIAHLNDLQEGNRYIQVGLRLPQIVDASEAKGRLLALACMVLSCVQPLSQCMYLGLDAYNAGMADGDIQHAFLGASMYLRSFLNSGLPFGPLLEDAEKFILQMLDYQQIMGFVLTVPIFQYLLCLSGKDDSPEDITQGKAIEMIQMLDNEKHVNLATETMLLYGMQLSYYMGKMKDATSAYEKLKDIDLGMAKASISYQVQIFFFGLICVESFRQTSRGIYKAEAKKYLELLREMVTGGAINLPHKVQLLEAEVSSLTIRDTKEIFQKYETAIVRASRAGFLQDSALSSLLYARMYIQHGDEESAKVHLNTSINLFREWGAVSVADSIIRRHTSLLPDVKGMPNTKSSGVRSRKHFREGFSRMHKSLRTAQGFYSSR